MSQWKVARCALGLGIFISTSGNFGPRSARADDTAALNAITTTADNICGIVKTSGKSDSSKTSGAVNVALTGLLKRLADLGISASSEIQTASYDGVLQTELAPFLKDVRACKQHVFDVLQEKLLKSRETISANGPGPNSGSSAAAPSSASTASSGADYTAEVLDDVAGRWTTKSPRECASSFYVWSVTGGQVTFRNQSEEVDIEQITGVSKSGFTTTTLLSVREQKHAGEKPGTKWEYTFQTRDSVLAKSFSDGRNFLFRRCTT